MLGRSFIRSHNGLILPSAIAAKSVLKGRRPKAMDFFAGAGGMSCGLIQAAMRSSPRQSTSPTRP